MSTVTCRHPKFNTTLYVTNHPRNKREAIHLSGNPNMAIQLPRHIANNIRDDLLENKSHVTVHATS